MNHDDAHLLNKLGSALATVPAQPDARELAALHRAVAACGQQSAPIERLGVASRTRRVHHPRVVAIGVVATTLTLGTGVAAAAGAPVLRQVREVAHEVGLPVDSPAVADTKQAIAHLRDTLARSDDSQVREARDRLRRELRGLSGSDRAAVQTHAGGLLRLADERLARRAVQSLSAPGRDSSSPASPGSATTSPKISGGTPPGPGQHSSDDLGDGGSPSGALGPATAGDSGDAHDGHDGGSPGATTTTSTRGDSGTDETLERGGSHGHDSTTTTTTNGW